MLTGSSGVLLAILLFADDFALFSYSASELQKQLDIVSSNDSQQNLRQTWIDGDCKEDKDSGL